MAEQIISFLKPALYNIFLFICVFVSVFKPRIETGFFFIVYYIVQVIGSKEIPKEINSVV